MRADGAPANYESPPLRFTYPVADENDPRNWRSGFAVFTFRGGELMPPELVTVLGPREVWFRGEVLTV